MLTCGQLRRWGWGGWINPLVYRSQHAVLFIGSLWGNSNRLCSGSLRISIVRPEEIGYLSFPFFILSMFLVSPLRFFLLRCSRKAVEIYGLKIWRSWSALFWPQSSLRCVPVKNISTWKISQFKKQTVQTVCLSSVLFIFVCRESQMAFLFVQVAVFSYTVHWCLTLGISSCVCGNINRFF